mmetsp:Transcript_67206/g.160357  ORF Transcript_67206/g.160357 Transcript_67206/m.160357 type:complete len:315 (-) Transcript_67206:432-1376(-)
MPPRLPPVLERPRLHIPHCDCPVGAYRYQCSGGYRRAWRVVDTDDWADMSRQLEQLDTSSSVPHANRLIQPDADQRDAVLQELHTEGLPLVPEERLCHVPAWVLHHLDRPTRHPTHKHILVLPRHAERRTTNLDGRQQLPRRSAPHIHKPVHAHRRDRLVVAECNVEERLVCPHRLFPTDVLAGDEIVLEHLALRSVHGKHSAVVRDRQSSGGVASGFDCVEVRAGDGVMDVQAAVRRRCAEVLSARRETHPAHGQGRQLMHRRRLRIRQLNCAVRQLCCCVLRLDTPHLARFVGADTHDTPPLWGHCETIRGR